MRKIYDILVSLNTAFGFFLGGIVLSLIGSLMLPGNLAFFSGIDDTPLFEWLSDAGELKITWWIYIFVIMMGALALSTVLCTIKALLGRATWANPAQRLSPQIMHLGVLFVMLGHLLTASVGTREDIQFELGQTRDLGGGVIVTLGNLDVESNEEGYYDNWLADLKITVNNNEPIVKTLMPAHPVYAGKLGLYFKTIRMGDNPGALIRVCNDPGAIWALVGGLMVMLGGVWFMLGKLRRTS